ncbi:hypothetical protein V8P49_11335 [Acinetobacter baumannii]
MHDLFKRFFKKSYLEKCGYVLSKGINVQIVDIIYDDEKLTAINVDGIGNVIFFDSIDSIYIRINGNVYLPQPRWTIQTKNLAIDIYSDVKNADKLFFKVLNKKLVGYGSFETQSEILNVLTRNAPGYYHVWKRPIPANVLRFNQVFNK